MSWDSETAVLGLDAGAFQGLSKLQRLQSLTVNFRVRVAVASPVALFRCVWNHAELLPCAQACMSCCIRPIASASISCLHPHCAAAE